MCMACNSGGSTKKKIILSSLMIAAIAVGLYFAYTLHNLALAVAMPLLLVLAPCLVMCGAIGGSWILPRLRNKKGASYDHMHHNSANPAEGKKDSQIFKNYSSDNQV